MTDDLNAPQEAALAALRELGGEATSSEIRAKADLGKTSAKDALRVLVVRGLVNKSDDPTPRYALAEAVGDAGGLSGQGAGEPTGGTVEDVLGFMEDVRPVPEVGPEDERPPKAPQAGVCTYRAREPASDDKRALAAPCGQGVHRDRGRWVHDDPALDDTHKATTRAFGDAPRRERKHDPERFWGKGALAQHVHVFLLDHPDDAFTPVAITKGLSEKYPDKVTQGGAVWAACERLTAQGMAKLVNDRPRKYQAE